MLNLAIVNKNLQNAPSKNFLIVSEDLSTQVIMYEKCLDAGVSEDNIAHHNCALCLENYLESYVDFLLIDAALFTNKMVQVLEKLVEKKNLKVFVYHSDDNSQTLRLTTNMRLVHINGATSAVILKKLLNN